MVQDPASSALHALRPPGGPVPGLGDLLEAASGSGCGTSLGSGAGPGGVRPVQQPDPYPPVLRGLLREIAGDAAHLMVLTDAAGRVLPPGRPPGPRRAGGASGVPITDPDTGRVIGRVEAGGAGAPHPAVAALVSATARLAEARLELAMRRRDDRLRERFLPHLRALRGEPAVLVTATGRVLAAEPAGWTGRRLPVPFPGAQIELPDGRPALAEPLGEVFLLRPPGVPDDRANPAGRTARTCGAGRRGAGPVPPSGADRRPLTLSLLGTDQPSARLDGRQVPLTLRHAEILALLALHPQGLNADRLSWHLYGEDGSPVTVRAEIHRLRGQLAGLVQAKPYRLACTLVDADFLTVRRLLDEGDVSSAVRLYRGELLPRSDAPAIRAERDELAVGVRGHVLDLGGPGSLWAYAQTDPGRSDLEVLERLRSVLPAGDPRLAAVASRSARLLEADGA
ncbi:helix-turn-helix domain-containing protein [Spirillospora sp. NBC_01491]|uniref:helix-turn-helix domain-containing protein n=1 Tax=Spirillospora sp. NBC_01491 TaxID=2976007 RepID=UPI002E356EF9|nr:helix-turn-helix domain-containing protein [Spirillospora sp. NBC_01491]